MNTARTSPPPVMLLALRVQRRKGGTLLCCDWNLCVEPDVDEHSKDVSSASDALDAAC